MELDSLFGKLVKSEVCRWAQARVTVTLAADLLKQAERLAKLAPKRPKQASLRRSISEADYLAKPPLTPAAAGESNG